MQTSQAAVVPLSDCAPTVTFTLLNPSEFAPSINKWSQISSSCEDYRWTTHKHVTKAHKQACRGGGSNELHSTASKLYIICEYSIAFFCNVPLSHSDPVSVCDETVNQIRRKQACKTVIEINLFVESAVYERSPSDVPSVTETKTLNWRAKTESNFFFYSVTENSGHSVPKETLQRLPHIKNYCTIHELFCCITYMHINTHLYAMEFVFTFNWYPICGPSTLTGLCGYTTMVWWLLGEINVHAVPWVLAINLWSQNTLVFSIVFSLFIQYTSPSHLIFPDLPNQHNVVHISFHHVMQKSVLKCTTIKTEGCPVSPA